MYRSLSIAALAILLFFANTTTAADKVVVVPLGGSSNPNVVDTSSGDATADNILKGKKAWVQGIEVIGTWNFVTRLFWIQGNMIATIIVTYSSPPKAL